MGNVEAVHHVAPAQIHRAEVLQQATQRSVLVELEPAREQGIDGPGGAQQLGAGDHDDPECRNQEDADPESPASERAFLGYGHDKAHLIREASPEPQGAQGALDAHNDEDRVIRVHVHRVQTVLRADEGGRGRGARAKVLVAASGNAGLSGGVLGLHTGGAPSLRGGSGRLLRLSLIHLVAVEVELGVCPALAEVGRPVRAESEPFLGYEDKPRVARARGIAWGRLEALSLAQKDDAQLPELRGRHGELVKVVLHIVAEDVDGLTEHVGGAPEDGHVPHHVVQPGLKLLGPLGAARSELGVGRGR